MRALVCPGLGQSLQLQELPPPKLGTEQVRIRVIAAGLNFADQLLLTGKYQEKLTSPFVPGFELSGEVIEVGNCVSSCKAGDRVLAAVIGGAWATEAVVHWHDVHVLPVSADLIQAAGFPIAYGTSHLALSKAGLKAGETLVVHGASGGVGLTAVEIGAGLGARVIACASSEEKLKIALEHGATIGLNSRSETLRDQIKDATDGLGAHVAYDPVGGEAFDTSLRSTRAGGRIIVIGFASGTIPQIPANILLVKNIAVLGFSWNAYRTIDPAAMRQSLADCIELWNRGRVHPHVSNVLPLDQVDQGMELLKNRTATGKVILQVAD
jgi:NADPH2:quinone reductase